MIRRFVRALYGAERFASALMVAIILVVVSVQVVSRYVLRSPTVGTDEAARYALVLTTFIGAAAVVAARGHVAVDFIVARLGPRDRRIMRIFSSAAVLTACMTMFAAGVPATLQRVGRTSTTLGLPAEFLFVAVLVALALMTTHAIVNLAEDTLGAEPAVMPATFGDEYDG